MLCFLSQLFEEDLDLIWSIDMWNFYLTASKMPYQGQKLHYVADLVRWQHVVAGKVLKLLQSVLRRSL